MVEEFNKLIDANTSVSKLRTLGFLSVQRRGSTYLF